MAPCCGKFVASSRRPLTKGNSARSAATASHAEAPSSPVKPCPLPPDRNRRRDNGSGGKSDRCIWVSSRLRAPTNDTPLCPANQQLRRVEAARHEAPSYFQQ